ncbi:MAG: hypothetical protein J6N21_18955, partial [Butyrivibrio sp.]|nr:hypothetical protein [Butyrivibrio sp.]
MRKKTLYLAFVTAFLLCACADNNTDSIKDDLADEASSATNIETIPTESSSIDETVEDNSNSKDNASDISAYSTGETDYKQAYKEILEYEQERIASLSADASSEEYEDTIDCYWLYDIDK